MEITLRDLVALVVIHGLTSNPSLGSAKHCDFISGALAFADEYMKQRDTEEEEEVAA